jgi:hypothetical protein
MTSGKTEKIILNQNIEKILKDMTGSDEAVQETKSRYHKIVQAGIAKWILEFQKGTIILSSVADLKLLIELDLELQK